MSYMDLACRESVSLMNGTGCFEYRSDRLRVGCNYKTYLYFELPPEAFSGRLARARLVLFKVPVKAPDAFFCPRNDFYCACPLLDYFSVYSNCFSPPVFDAGLCADYADEARAAYTEIDVTEIARAWLKGKPENKGLLLDGRAGAAQIVYASGRHEAAGMRPLLRLAYEGASPPLNAAPCTVKVNQQRGKR